MLKVKNVINNFCSKEQLVHLNYASDNALKTNYGHLLNFSLFLEGKVSSRKRIAETRCSSKPM